VEAEVGAEPNQRAAAPGGGGGGGGPPGGTGRERPDLEEGSGEMTEEVVELRRVGRRGRGHMMEGGGRRRV
jgi:hypothetical protein